MKTKQVKGAGGKSHLELVEGSNVVKIYAGMAAPNRLCKLQ